MENVEINTIYNIPEALSGIGFKCHFIGLFLFILLFILGIPCLLIDKTYLQDSLQLIQDSGLFVVLAMFFIFVLCPLYFLARFFMELCRTKKARCEFYTTPNIKYITFYNNNLFFKNTIKNSDFSIMKSEIINAELKGIVRTITGVTRYGAPLVVTFIENLILTIETKDKKIIIFPAVKINLIKRIIMNEEEIIKLQIDLYQKHFLNFVTAFESDNAPESKIIAFKLNNYNS